MVKKRISLTLSALLLLVLSACTSNPSTPSIGDPPQIPAVELTVQADTSGPINSVGHTIQYTFNIKNIGNVPLPGVVSVTGATVNCPPVNTVGNKDEFLDVNEVLICVSSYTTVQADLDNGSITIVTRANVNGTLSNEVTTKVDTAPNRILTLTKTVNPTTYDHIGQTITYNYEVKNNGTADIGPTQFVVTDMGISTPLNCGNMDTTLTPNAIVSCSISYTITQADMDTGTVTTSATVSGGGVGPSQPASATATKSNTSNLTPGTTVSHVVLEGEWLWQIARCYGADPNEVVKANPQIPNPAMIKAGRIVSVPNIGSKGKIYQTKPPIPCIAKHTVQAGETWNSIAQKYNADVIVLQMVNLNNLSIGVVLKVPLNSAGGNAVYTPGSTTSTCVDLTRSLKLANLNANTTHFNVCGAMDASGTMKIGTITVYQRPEDVGLGGLSQNITLPETIETITPINNGNSLIVGDMNYDGNDDFRVVRYLPAGTNIPYVYYLFDPATSKFIYNEAYGKITSPEFPGNMEIRSQWRENAGKWGIDTYIIDNNNPVLSKRETWEAVSETQAKHQVLKFTADGSSTVTVDELVPLPIP